MRIVVPVKAVPDLVEEIELTPDGSGIEREYLKFVLNEWDAQALEEALLIKDAGGAEVVAVGLADDPEIDQILYTALAKGANAAVKLVGTNAGGPPGRAGTPLGVRASLMAAYLQAEPADLVISGVQATDDPDGQLVPLLAALLDLPHVSVVVSVEAGDGAVLVRQEFSGGRSHELAMQMPAVIGVQSARQAPRYAPVSRVKQATQAGGLTELAVSPPGLGPGLALRRLCRPEASSHAEMLSGSPGDVADRILGLLRSRGLVKG
jgi:electron transfer flavoprotein beta subunit